MRQPWWKSPDVFKDRGADDYLHVPTSQPSYGEFHKVVCDADELPIPISLARIVEIVKQQNEADEANGFGTVSHDQVFVSHTDNYIEICFCEADEGVSLTRLIELTSVKFSEVPPEQITISPNLLDELGREERRQR